MCFLTQIESISNEIRFTTSVSGWRRIGLALECADEINLRRHVWEMGEEQNARKGDEDFFGGRKSIVLLLKKDSLFSDTSVVIGHREGRQKL